MNSAPSFTRSTNLLHRERSQLLIVDMQEKLLPVIPHADQLVSTCQFLLKVAELLKVPVSISEQYPKGLGYTIPQITDHPASNHVFEKLKFSAAEEFLKRPGAVNTSTDFAEQVVIAGIETHICVLQTALDLLAAGTQVLVVEDAVGSRNSDDEQSALHRIRDAGGTVCSAESVVFEWCEVAGTDEFRQISRLVRERDAARPDRSASS